jgi:hypothetical protein
MLSTSNAGLSKTNQITAFVERLFLRRQSSISVAIFGFSLIAMVVARCSVAMYGTRIYSLDGFIMLDGAWRMLNGQRPNVDFNSIVGPAQYLPTVIGFSLASNTAAGFGYGQALVALILGAWAYLLGGKLYETPRVIYALCVAAIAVDPAQLGISPFMISPATTYNRFGYALLGVLLLECLSTEVSSELIAGISSGALISLLAFTKMTSFFAGVVLLVALTQQRIQTYRRWFGLAAGAALVGLPFLYYLRFDVPAVIRDLAITAISKKVRYKEIYLFNSIALDAGIALLLTFGAFSFLLESGKPRAAKRVLLAGVIVIAASVLLIFGNYQPSDLPLLGLLLLMISNRLLSNRLGASTAGSGTSSMVIGGSAIFAGVTVISAVFSLACAQWVKTHSVRAAGRFEVPALRQFVPLRDDQHYTDYENDGFTLLQQHRKAGERVMALDFVNPFSYGLLIPPAPGGSTNLQYNATFNEKHKVSPERLFGAADLVMVPKTFSDDSLQLTVPANYGAFLESHFRLVGESSQWKLYRRLAPETH